MYYNFSCFPKIPIALFCLIFMQCINDADTADNSLLEASITSINESESLLISTPYGSSEVVHPDIIFLQEQKFGYHFFMAITPYPLSDDLSENPCLYASNDGTNFTEPIEGINPIVPAPSYGHNDDPDIFYDNDSGVFVLHYLETMYPDSQNLVRLTSSDGIIWQKETAINYIFDNGDEFILSPSLIKNSGFFRMFYINADGNQFRYLDSPDGKTWDKYALKEIHTGLPDSLHPWHADVFSDGDRYYIVWNGFSDNKECHDLFIAVSSDLNIWHFSDVPIMSHGHGSNIKKYYRSSGIVFKNTLALWYSYKTDGETWGVGVKKFSIDSLLTAVGLSRY
jgi:hypothetical protein